MNWKAVTEELPDDDMTVLLYAPDGFDPVFVGSKNGNSWIDQNGLELNDGYVTHWADFPAPPEVGK
jgi:hypothetical protein